MATVDFRAWLNDGTTISQAECPSVMNLPLEKVYRLDVMTDKPNCPQLTIHADLESGERVWKFTRHIMKMDPNFMAITGGGLDVDVFELRDAEEKTICRLYWHPIDGPILTTRDLSF